MSNDLEDLISDITPEKASPKIIEEIHESLCEMCDIAIGIEVGSESIISDVKKTKKQYHDAKKRTIKPIKVYKEL